MEAIKTFFDAFGGTIQKLAESTGFVTGTWQQFVMIGIACLLLWLAIVKKSVELHGGSITFLSEIGRGTCFSVLLPIAKR